MTDVIEVTVTEKNEMNTIKINNLQKTYGLLRKKNIVRALDGVSIEVGKGEIFGLLGPNGAGKTTLIKILLGICRRSGGSAAILGHDIPSVASRKSVGFLPEDIRFPNYMKGRCALMTFGRIMRVPNLRAEVDRHLQMVGMAEAAGRKIKNYSRGMTRRIGLALALLNNPRVVFLDEPTDGLDPMGRRYIRELLMNMKERGKTIFLNSHILGEVETVCDRVAILNRGRVVRVGKVDELTDGGSHCRITVSRADDALDSALSPIMNGYARDGNAISFTVRDESELDRAIDTIRARGVGLRELVQLKDTLEDVFLKTISGENQNGPSGDN